MQTITKTAIALLTCATALCSCSSDDPQKPYEPSKEITDAIHKTFPAKRLVEKYSIMPGDVHQTHFTLTYDGDLLTEYTTYEDQGATKVYPGNSFRLQWGDNVVTVIAVGGPQKNKPILKAVLEGGYATQIYEYPATGGAVCCERTYHKSLGQLHTSTKLNEAGEIQSSYEYFWNTSGNITRIIRTPSSCRLEYNQFSYFGTPVKNALTPPCYTDILPDVSPYKTIYNQAPEALYWAGVMGVPVKNVCKDYYSAANPAAPAWSCSYRVDDEGYVVQTEQPGMTAQRYAYQQ